MDHVTMLTVMIYFKYSTQDMEHNQFVVYELSRFLKWGYMLLLYSGVLWHLFVVWNVCGVWFQKPAEDYENQDMTLKRI